MSKDVFVNYAVLILIPTGSAVIKLLQSTNEGLLKTLAISH